MNTRQCSLAAYRLMLRLYPPAFRNRFAPEMLQLAEEAEPAEWLLIFGDTSVAIMRCWIEGSPSTAAQPEPNAYLPLGGFPVRASGVVHGFVLSTAIILALCYIGYRWPPPCQSSRQLVTRVVGPTDTKTPIAERTLRVRQVH